MFPYVFYNGTEKQYFQKELCLSDAFPIKTGALELVAKCYDINLSEGNELLESCHELKSYSVFIQKVRDGQADGLSLRQAIREAVKYCETHDWMKEYFVNHESEVFDMVAFKWDDAKALKIAKEEYLEEGEAIGEARGVKKGIIQVALGLIENKVPLHIITASTKLTAAEVEEIARKNGLAI